MSENTKKNKFLLSIEIAINILGLCTLFLITWFLAYRYNLNSPFLYKKGTALLVLIYGALYILFSNIYDAHNIGHLRVSEIIYSQILSIFVVNAITFFQICLIDRRVVAIKPLLFLTIVDFIFIIIWAYYSNKNYHKRNPALHLIVIYGHEVPKETILKLKSYENKFKVVKVIKDSTDFEKILEIIGPEAGILLSRVHPIVKKKLLKYCYENNIACYIIPNIMDIMVRGAESLNLLDTPLLYCNSGEISLLESFIKRSMDIVISFITLLILSPILLLTAVLIKLEDGGPVFFIQKRLTIGGKLFKVYKFRSMVPDAEKDGIARLAKENDNRITRIGKIIRPLRIDEIPQIYNILKGEMSIVGPRPERPEIAAHYIEEMPEFEYRLKVKAGLTGYAQVMGRYNTTHFDKLKLDMMYIAQYSLYLDLKLMLMTIKIIFLPESSQGFDESQKTAYKNEDD